MPSATPQDADDQFVTRIMGSFAPNGAGAPLNVVVPSNCTLVRAGVGIFDLTLPAGYTSAVIQLAPMVVGMHFKGNVGDTPIFVASSAQTLPVVRILTTLGNGVNTDFAFIAGQFVQFRVYLKYFTELTF